LKAYDRMNKKVVSPCFTT